MPAADREKLEQALAQLPIGLQPGVRNWLLHLSAEYPLADAQLCAEHVDYAGILRLAACSEFAANAMLRNWDHFFETIVAGAFNSPPTRMEIERRFAALLESISERDEVLSGLRQLRNQILVHILWSDLVIGCQVKSILAALSDLADIAIATAVRFATRHTRRRFGDVLHDGQRVPLVVIAMGKLGGHELNFSSDIDIVFAYPHEATSNGHRSVSAHEYFTRVAREVVALLEETTADGFVYRVDTRLRPFGDSGAPVISFAGLEDYLLKHGRGWERYAYVKARVVAPAGDTELQEELNAGVLYPFVYRRYLDYGVFESLREMKALVETQVRKREMMDNIKLGPGGIREIEFIVQALQLLRGGSIVALRTTQLRTALRAAAGHDMTEEDALNLLDAYEFLRRVENILQAVRDQQTHDLPTDSIDQERLAFAMGFVDWPAFAGELVRVRDLVNEQFSAIAFRDAHEPQQPSEFAELWSSRADAAAWQRVFEDRGFNEPAALAEEMASFAALPSTKRTDAVAAKRLRKFIPNLLRELNDRPRPATTLQRVISILDQVLRRSAYLALLNENAGVMQRLLNLCANSSFLARELARFPALLDELIDTRIFDAVPETRDLRDDLAERVAAVAPDDVEGQIEALAEFKRATHFRLAVADFNGSIPVMRVSDRLTDIAEAILGHALDLARRDLVERMGQPGYTLNGRRFRADLGIVAYGKLGGIELSYGSDLDIVLLHDSQGEQQHTDGAKHVDNSVFFGRLARRLVHFLTTRTESGLLYDVDMRLRPSGSAGLLVTSIDAFELYQEQNAWTWEHQALLRGRVVAGSAIVAREFERIRSHTLKKRVRRADLRADVAGMRQKMRDNLDKTNADFFDLKQGAGAIADIEFLVQYLVLLNADKHPAVIHYTDNIRQLGTLAAAGCLTEDDSRRLQQIYRRLRARSHRLVLDEQPAREPASEFAEERAFVQAIWERELGNEL